MSDGTLNDAGGSRLRTLVFLDLDPIESSGS